MSFLTADEQRIQRIALHELSGGSAIGEIYYARTGPELAGGVAKRWLEHVAATWEARGWLVRDGDPTHQRRVVTNLVGPLLRLAAAEPGAPRVNT